MNKLDVKRFIVAKVNAITSKQLLHRLKKAVERKHHKGFMTTEIYEYTMEKIEDRMKEFDSDHT